jgi:hypothetical protein
MCHDQSTWRRADRAEIPRANASHRPCSGRCNYISNADRKDVVALMKEQIKLFEGQA